MRTIKSSIANKGFAEIDRRVSGQATEITGRHCNGELEKLGGSAAKTLLIAIVNLIGSI